MFLTGFADEASSSFDVQLKATRELRWHFIESRVIDGKNLSSLSEPEFDAVCEKLAANDIRINCFGSSVANWKCHPRSDEHFQASRETLLKAIPRMKKLGIGIIRGMSFLVPDNEKPDSPELEKIIFDKVRELCKICEDNGIIYGHENCMNYGGLSYKHTLKMLEKVNNPALKLIFDTGNPVFNPRFLGEPPYPMQSAWEFYRNVREHIVYVHIKDGTAIPQEGKFRPDCDFCFAGDGCGDVRAIVTDLLKTGYDGGFSIEPHIAHVFHAENEEDKAEYRYRSYIEYGMRFEKLLAECKLNAFGCPCSDPQV